MRSSNVAGLAALALLGVGAYRSAVLSYADRLAQRGGRTELVRAIALAPENSENYLRLAAADPQSPVDIIKTAIRMNPREPRGWLELAAATIQSGDPQQGEEYLMRAAELDKTFAPRWKLAELYATTGNVAKFWPAMRKALSMAQDDLTPAFELCWSLSGDSQTVLDRALPNDPEVIRRYLLFLLNGERLQAAHPVAARLSEFQGPAITSTLLEYCNRSLQQGAAGPALQVWNGLCDRGRLPYPGLRPEAGRIITNGTFGREFIQSAFDWRLSKVPDVVVSRVSPETGLKFKFFGDEPENFVLLSQYIPLSRGKKYQVTVRYTTSNIPPLSGLSWRIKAGRGKTEYPPGGSLLAAGAPAEQQIVFTSAADLIPTDVAELTFYYRRAPGTVRIAGICVIHEVSAALVD